MKLRIRDDSIRLRLARTEVAEIADGRTVESRCRFPDDATLVYRLTAGNSDQPDALFDAGLLEVRWPAGALRAWARDDSVSLLGERPLAGGGSLKLLVEKDFQCLTDRPDEDETDLYPHPNAEHGDCG